MRQPSRGRLPLMRRGLAAALAAASCAAACMLVAATGTAMAGAAATTTSSRPAQAPRFGVLRHIAPERPAIQASAPSAAHAAGLVMLDGSPGASAANPKTGTVYVPIQCVHTDCIPGQPEHVVDVVNAAKCNAMALSGCRVAARLRVGTGPIGAVVDEKTDTIYVTNGNDNTVSVIDGSRCNAEDTSGCAMAVVATVKVGTFPVADAFNPASRTVYIANLAGSISVINAATCNATITRGCGHPVRSVPDKRGPAWIDIDRATGTVYVADSGISSPGDTVSVINGRTCNGHAGRGCRVLVTVKVGTNPSTVTVDQATNTTTPLTTTE